MIDGTIIKGIGGFYYVKTQNGTYECKARGKFKKDKFILRVGDYVSIDVQDADKMLGSIERVGKRKNEMLRPAVANVDQAMIVFAVAAPAPNINLLDKMIVLAEEANLDVVLCFNKMELDESYASVLKARYEKVGYSVMLTSAKNEKGIVDLKNTLNDQVTVFAGPSGVGKSSLLNLVQEGLALQTGEISEKIKRGKHTTRHSELIPLNVGGMVVDTPGFTSLKVDFIELELLKDYFIEFTELGNHCKFANCLHLNEPGCAVKAALEDGEVDKERYESYKYFMNEIEEFRRYKKW